MIDHIGIPVADYEASKLFYLQALASLGMTLIAEVEGWAGFGKERQAQFWFGVDERAQAPISPLHIAFLAETREAVDQFYQAALSAGAKDNGAPGIRAVYHPDYYGAFVIDPSGHNVEAVCHQSEP